MQGLGRKVKAWFGLGVMALGSLACSPPTAPDSGPWEISVRFSEALGAPPQDGRLLLLLSAREGAEPRFQVNNNADSQLIFGRNVEGWDGVSPVTFKGAGIGLSPCRPSSRSPGHLPRPSAAQSLQGFHALKRENREPSPGSRGGAKVESQAREFPLRGCGSHPWPRLGAGGDCHGSASPPD